MKKIDRLRKQAAELIRQIGVITDAEEQKQLLPFLNKCFRYRNSYDHDRSWFLYARVIRIDGSDLHMFTVQKTIDGRIDIRLDESCYLGSMPDHTEITEAAYKISWSSLCAEIAGYRHRP